MAKVAVENSLGSVKEALQNSGFEVVGMDSVGNADCCVISGQDENFMGMADISTQASVINCEGLTTEEVVSQVSDRVSGAQ